MTTSATSGTSSSSSADSIVSIAGTSSADAAGGSVINVSGIVSELVEQAEDPQESIIEQQTESVTADISAMATLKSALTTFQSSLTSLDTSSAFNSMTATTGDSTLLTATADSDATSGTYNVSVSQLAQAQQLRSKVFTGGASATVGTGTLSLSLGGSSFSVPINSSNDTLAGIASQINSASGNPGITASVLQGTAGAYLLLSSSVTGAANTISVSETDTGDGLAALTYSSADSTNYSVETAAQDATYSIAGVAGTSASNTISSALSGVTLNLLGTTGTTGTSVSISADTSTIETNIGSFVSAYNKMLSGFNSLGSYSSSTDKAGTLMGNGLLTNIQSQTNEAIYNVVDTGSSVYNSLASIGITTNSDGTLSVNETTLSNALSTNLSAVSTLFSGTGGVASTLNTEIGDDLSANGSVTDEDSTLSSQETSLTTQSNTLQTQMSALSASLTQEYASLNSMLSTLQTTSSYLTQAFDELPKVQSTASA